MGRSLRWRLEAMRERLPPRFRPVAADVLARLDEIETLPWVLTHGDLVPGNIIVEVAPPEQPEEGGGKCETSLRRGRCAACWTEPKPSPSPPGSACPVQRSSSGRRCRRSRGRYLPRRGRTRLRTAGSRTTRRLVTYGGSSWGELRRGIPELADAAVRDTVERARDMGVLLWHGIAFDDGRLDRVVEEGRRDEEIQRLEMFLFGTDGWRALSEAEAGSEPVGLECPAGGGHIGNEAVEERASPLRLHLAWYSSW